MSKYLLSQDMCKTLGFPPDSHLGTHHPLSNAFPLHEAVVLGDLDIVTGLIEAKANLNQLDDHRSPLRKGRTPLLLSIFEDDDEMVALLLDAKADSHDCGKGCLTPLMGAAVGGNRQLLIMLIEAGANINQETQKGRDGNMTALMRATRLGHTKAACCLLELGASLENSQGISFLDFSDAKWTRPTLVAKVTLLMRETEETRGALKALLPWDLVGLVASYTAGFSMK